jgi:hypothetical protein
MSDVSTLFDLLTSAGRRRLLVALCDAEAVDVSDGRFTRAGGTTDANGRDGDANGRDPDALRDHEGRPDADAHEDAVRLYHVDLPKLAAAGAVVWDRDTGVVSRGPRFDAYEPAVRLLATNEGELPGPFY